MMRPSLPYLLNKYGGRWRRSESTNLFGFRIRPAMYSGFVDIVQRWPLGVVLKAYSSDAVAVDRARCELGRRARLIREAVRRHVALRNPRFELGRHEGGHQ